MSKFSLTDFDDTDITLDLISGLTEKWHELKKSFPAALIITEEQGKKFFFQAGEIVGNFKGIPLEIQKKADERATVLKTINGILTGMHTAGIKEVPEVYRLLEAMKDKIGGSDVQSGQV